jgi:hypothetical protein
MLIKLNTQLMLAIHIITRIDRKYCTDMIRILKEDSHHNSIKSQPQIKIII